MNRPPSSFNMLLSRHTRRRAFIAGLGGAAAWPLVARGQPSGMRRIVFLSAFDESYPREQAQLAVFVDELRKLGWVKGQNISIEFLWRAATSERASTYVMQLVKNRPDVVVAGTLQAFLAMRRQAGAIPMVFANLPDPVVMGFVANLAKPDGNFTGFTAYEFATGGKWLEVLKELAPRVSRVAMIFANSTQPVGENFYRAMQAVARPLGVETTAIRIDSAEDVQTGINAFVQEPNGGLAMAADAGLSQSALVADLAARHQLPAVYPDRQIVQKGAQPASPCCQNTCPP